MELQRDRKNDITSSKSPLRVELSDKLFKELTDVLNEVHDQNFTLRFWKLLLTGHVNAVISRKKLLEKREYFRNPDLVAINGFSFPGRKQKFKNSLIRIVKYMKMRPNKTRYKAVLKNHDELLLGFPDSKALRKENLGIKLPKYDRLYIGFGDTEKRKKLNRIAERYDDVYMKNVVRELPKILVEHFQNIYNSIELHNPEKKTFHVHLHSTLYNQFVVAKYIEHGAKLYWYQHGSEYGEFQFDYAHILSHDLANEFRTWGWKIYEKDKTWKAYRLETFKEGYDKFNEEEKYKLLICYPEFNYKNRPVYEQITNKLLTNLDSQRYDKILARPRRSNKLHSHASQLEFIGNINRVDISSGLEPMMKEMQMCKIVLQLNVPSTNFLECLYVDHPTIGILNNDQPTDIIKPFYDFFKEQGVLHDNIESLVNHLNQINLEDWWTALMKEEMYKSYKQTFARKAD